MVRLAGVVQNGQVKIEQNLQPNENFGSENKTTEQNLWDDCGQEIVDNLVQTTGCSEDDAKAKAQSAISYAANLMDECDKANENGEKDGKITFEEWTANSQRLDYMGVTEEEGREIFNGIDLDGDKGLSAKELIALNLFKDATSNKETEGTLNNNINVETENEQNGIKTIAENMKALAKEEGKNLFQDLYATAFGSNAANIASATKAVRSSLEVNTTYDPADLDYMTQDQVDTAVQAFEKYLTAEMNDKDTDNDSFISYDEWATDVTFQYMGIDQSLEDAVPWMKTVFAGMDINNDGKLDANEVASQYLYRDITSAIQGYKEGDSIGTAQMFDGNVLDEDGYATNLTNSIEKPEDVDMPAIEWARNNFLELAKEFGIYNGDENYAKFDVQAYV